MDFILWHTTMIRSMQMSLAIDARKVLSSSYPNYSPGYSVKEVSIFLFMNSAERFFALKISLVMAVRMLGLFMLFPVMSVYAGDYESATPFLIGMAIGIYGLTQAIFQIPFGYLSDRFGRKPILIVGLLIFLLGSILAAILQILSLLLLAEHFKGEVLYQLFLWRF